MAPLLMRVMDEPAGQQVPVMRAGVLVLLELMIVPLSTVKT